MGSSGVHSSQGDRLRPRCRSRTTTRKAGVNECMEFSKGLHLNTKLRAGDRVELAKIARLPPRATAVRRVRFAKPCRMRHGACRGSTAGGQRSAPRNCRSQFFTRAGVAQKLCTNACITTRKGAVLRSSRVRRGRRPLAGDKHPVPARRHSPCRNSGLRSSCRCCGPQVALLARTKALQYGYCPLAHHGTATTRAEATAYQLGSLAKTRRGAGNRAKRGSKAHGGATLVVFAAVFQRAKGI